MANSFQGRAIYLRPFEEGDVPGIFEYINHPDLEGRRYIPWDFPATIPLSKDQVAAIYEKWKGGRNNVHLAVVLRESHQLVGHAMCDWGWDPHCPDLELVIDPEHQLNKFGSEVLYLLLRFLFENQPAHVVTTWVADWNEAGSRFLQENDFQESGRMRRAGMRRGGYFDIIIFDILRSEWKQRREWSNHAC